MGFTRAFVLSSGLFLVLAGCAEPALDSKDLPTAPSAAVALDLRPGVENYVALSGLPNASCVVRDEADDSGKGLDVSTSADGTIAFFVKPRAAGSVTRLNVACSDGAGAIDSHALELRGVADVPALAAPSPKGRIRPALTNPDALSNDELHAAGYRSRPDPARSPAQYQRWLESVSRPAVDLSESVTFASMKGRASPKNTGNWAGYQQWSDYLCFGGSCHQLDNMLVVTGTWSVPYVYAPNGDWGNKYDASVWVGLGDGTSAGGSMWQAGEDNSVLPTPGSEIVKHQIWYELLCHANPCPGGVVINGYYPQVNDTFVTELWFGMDSSCTTGLTGNDSTQWLGYFFENAPTDPNQQTRFFSGCINVQDLYNSQNVAGPWGSTIWGGSAEWIVERAWFGYLPPLAYFGTLNMTGVNAFNSSNGWQDAISGAPLQIWMVNSSNNHTLAESFGFTTVNGPTVQVAWNNYQ